MSDINNIEDDIITQEIDTLKGMGPVSAKKFKQEGIVTIMDLASNTTIEVAERVNMNRETLSSFILQAQEVLKENGVLERQIVPARRILEKRKTLNRLSLGCKSLDEITFGGIETQAMTEFYGEFGSGKSQICFTLCAMVSQPLDLGGLGGSAIFIDTEGTFRPDRIQQMAISRGFDPDSVIDNIQYVKIYNASHLQLTVRDIPKYITEHNSKLIIIDSIVSLHRAEFTGRGTLSERQQKLNSILHKLLRIAEIYNVAVVVTNQVITSPGNLFGDPLIPAGGNIIGHTSTYRIYLRKSGRNRIFRIIDSPSHPTSDARFTVNEKGTDEVEDEPKKRKITEDDDDV